MIEKPQIILRIAKEGLAAEVELSIKEWKWDKGCSSLITPNTSTLTCDKKLEESGVIEILGGHHPRATESGT